MKDGDTIGSPVGVASPRLHLPCVWETMPVGWSPNWLGITPHPSPIAPESQAAGCWPAARAWSTSPSPAGAGTRR